MRKRTAISFLSDALSHEQLKKWPREYCNRKGIVTHLFPGLRIRQAQWPTAFCSSSSKSASSASSTFFFQLSIKKVIKTSDHHETNKKAIFLIIPTLFLFTVYVDFLSAVWQFCTKKFFIGEKLNQFNFWLY